MNSLWLVFENLFVHGKKAVKGFHLYTFGKLRQLYDWVLSWAHTPYGTPALCCLSFAESSFFPIPPDVLQIPLTVSHPRRAFWYASVSTIASVLGGIAGFGIGLFLEPLAQGIIRFLGYGSYFTLVGQLYADNVFWAVFSAALTPIPYKVFTLGAGVFNVAFWPFVLASVLGRGLRFFGVATLLYFFGPKMKEFIEKYFDVLSVFALVLIALGFVAVKYLM